MRKGQSPGEPLEQRLRYEVVNGCWNWVGATNPKGYGIITLRNPKRSENVHRLAYLLYVGEIPDEMHVHHVCENRRCINPEHLRLETPADHARLHFAGKTKGV